ncbi:diguanylate cyclase [Alicyclobacillus tengchongensis]|nr:diguanylate cyclase [Alicyclobacillus tengchongensis]
MTEGTTLWRQNAYSAVVGIAGCLVALYGLPSLRHENGWLVAAMAVIASLLESLPIPLRQAQASLLPAVIIALVGLGGLEPAMVCGMLAACAAPLFLRTWDSVIVLFNAGQYALSTCALWLVLHALHPLPIVSVHAIVLFDIAVGSLVFLVVNHLLVHTLQWLRGNLLPSSIVSALVTDAANLALCLPFAVLVLALAPDNVWFEPVVMLPLAMLAYMLRAHRQTLDLQMIHEATTKLATEFDIRAIAAEAAILTRRMTLADCVVVFLIDNEHNALVPMAVYPQAYDHLFDKNGWPEEEGGAIWKTIHHRAPVHIPDVRKDARVRILGDHPTFLSMAIFPMHAHLKAHGAIVCYAKRPRAFAHIHQYMDTLSNQVSVLLENAKLYQELQERTFRDEATGLFNYRYFYEELAKRVQTSVTENRPVSVLIADVDFFKKFNDTYGHLAGDVVLREVGRLLQRHAGAQGIAARYGGEEFAVLMWANAEEAYRIAEQIRQEVSRLAVKFHGYHLQGISVSVGVATCPDHSVSDRDLLLKADSAMYWGAKQRGRNRTAMYAPEFDTQLFVDSLTSLYTHHFVNIRIRDDMMQGVTKWGVICIDLNQFGKVNAGFGFDVGDAVLRQVGVLVRQCLRHTELACRYGGDEILIVLPDVAETEIAGVCDRVVNAIEQHRYVVSDNVVFSMRTTATYRVFEDAADGPDLFNRVAEMFVQLSTASEQTMA